MFSGRCFFVAARWARLELYNDDTSDVDDTDDDDCDDDHDDGARVAPRRQETLGNPKYVFLPSEFMSKFRRTASSESVLGVCSM